LLLWCSYTYGQGIRISDRYDKFIDQHLKYKSNNFGISGIGIDEILSVFATTSRFIKMKKAIFLLPSCYRQYINGYNIFPNSVLDGNPGKKYADIWYRLPSEYFIDRATTSIQIILRLAELQNIQCILTSYRSETVNLLPYNSLPEPIIESDKLGSDKHHPGPDWHKSLAEQFINIL
jgi:hypothetical protein